MNTMEIPKTKFIVKVWPNNAADAIPVKIVATVDEYFFRIVSTHKKNPNQGLEVEKHKDDIQLFVTAQEGIKFSHQTFTIFGNDVLYSVLSTSQASCTTSWNFPYA